MIYDFFLVYFLSFDIYWFLNLFRVRGFNVFSGFLSLHCITVGDSFFYDTRNWEACRRDLGTSRVLIFICRVGEGYMIYVAIQPSL